MSVRIALGALLAAIVLAAPASRPSPPVGPLPAGPTQQMTTAARRTRRGRAPARGQRPCLAAARAVNPKVLREVGEANVGPNVVVVFKAFSRGRVTVSYGLTRGETSHAYAARRFVDLRQ